MTLATHAVVGGAVASLFPSHPTIAFFAGFFCHFIFDAIPHWDYKILSKYANPDTASSSQKAQIDRYFGLDLLRIGADVFLGILITLVVWQPTTLSQLQILALGVFGGTLPDFLLFVYTRFPYQPMISMYKFHDFMHADSKLTNRPFLGILLQIVVMICTILLVKYLIQF